MKNFVLNFIKNRDIFTKSIKKIIEQEDKIIVEYENKKIEYIFIMNDEFDIPSYESVLVFYNNMKNLKNVFKSWDKLCENKNLSIMFINPDSTTDKKWIIKPYIHNRITEPSSLKKGLEAMYNTVEPKR